MKMDLVRAIQEVDENFINYHEYLLTGTYFKPSYIVVLASYLACQKQLISSKFQCDDDRVGEYLQAIGFYDALWGHDGYQNTRRNVGKNYSLLTCIKSEEFTHDATAMINNCIRSHFTDINNEISGLHRLTHVVGELHDNVWSHGKSTGFSLAQKYAVPGSNRCDHYLEFSLADSGYGFLAETKRVGKSFVDHLEALLWCIEEGNSTKHSKDIDDWAQTIPNDLIGSSPFGDKVKTRFSENHHQGLGLYHLVELVRAYKGELILVSGNACFEMDENAQETNKLIGKEWKGVAISCRFKASNLSSIKEEISQSDRDIMDLLVWKG